MNLAKAIVSQTHPVHSHRLNRRILAKRNGSRSHLTTFRCHQIICYTDKNLAELSVGLACRYIPVVAILAWPRVCCTR